MKQTIQLSDHFTYGKLFRFTLPSIVMMVFTSIYSVVDGFFISNYAGKTAFAALNLIYPFLMILGGMGFMIGTGGTALVSRCLGAGQKERARRYFSMLVEFTALLGLILHDDRADRLSGRGAHGHWSSLHGAHCKASGRNGRNGAGLRALWPHCHCI